MNLYPYEKFELTINEKIQDVVKRLDSKTTTRGLWSRYLFHPEEGKVFRGKVYKDSFLLSLRFSYRTPPILYGSLEPDLHNHNHTKIVVKAKFNPIIFIFITFWLVFGIFAFETFEPEQRTFLVAFSIIPAALIYFIYCRELQHTITKFLEVNSENLVQLNRDK
jgi:hypothetical protein